MPIVLQVVGSDDADLRHQFIDRPAEIEQKAKELTDAGFRFFMELLPTREVNLQCRRIEAREFIKASAAELEGITTVVPNGPMVQTGLDELVTTAHSTLLWRHIYRVHWQVLEETLFSPLQNMPERIEEAIKLLRSESPPRREGKYAFFTTAIEDYWPMLSYEQRLLLVLAHGTTVFSEPFSRQGVDEHAKNGNDATTACRVQRGV